MKTLGIDLAAEAKGTAVSVIEWVEGEARLSRLLVGATDEQILELATGAQKVGIDCALGWPVDFVSFLQDQFSFDSHSSTIDGGLDWRRRMAYRETDRRVRLVTGRWPLSVATDRLGMTALRCSGLLARFQRTGVKIDRSGAGLIVEIYPSASLRIWGFSFSGYRNSSEIRSSLLDELKAKAPWLRFDDFRQQLVLSCDAFDSFIAALATRAAALGFFEPPEDELLNRAQAEGWIALPNVELEQLLAK